MRELGQISSEQHAHRFIRVMQAQSVTGIAELEGGQWTIWIEEEDRREEMQKLFEDFCQDPEASVYKTVEAQVRKREKPAKRKQASRDRGIELRRRWEGHWWYSRPSATILIGLTVLFCVATTNWRDIQLSRFGVPRLCNQTDSKILTNSFAFDMQVAAEPQTGREFLVPRQSFNVQPQPGLQFELTPQPQEVLSELYGGELWRLVTPIFIHMDVLHIFLNLMWIRALGYGVEFVRGTRRFLLLVFVTAVFSTACEIWWQIYDVRFLSDAYPGVSAFGGLSGVVFGLIGYVWTKGRLQPDHGLSLRQEAFVYSVIWMLLCMGGALGAIANAAHLGGLIAGLILGARGWLLKKILPDSGN